MTTVCKSALVPYTPEEMFALVADIPSYPEFLPWCCGARIIESTGDEVRAEITLKKGGVEKAFATRNVNAFPASISMRLAEGPFKSLKGGWKFTALGEVGCKIELDIEFEFASKMLAMVVGPVFTHLMNSLVDSFQKRAVEVYGRR